MDAGDVAAVTDVSVGFDGLDGEWSSDATVVLPSGGDTLATDLVQGDPTARAAYDNFEPDGRYLEVPSVGIESVEPVPAEFAETLEGMAGPAIDTAERATHAIEYRINL